MDDTIMKVDNVLPADFDGVFKFTNWSDEEFVGVWGKKEYHFVPNATSPMVIPEHSPLEIQQIRKKFAKDLAEREFYKTEKYGRFQGQERTAEGVAKLNSIHQAASYTMDDLTEGIQKCLKPLEEKRAFVETVEEIPMESKLSKDDEGNLNTMAVDRKVSLKERALSGQGLPQ